MEFLHVDNDDKKPVDSLKMNWYYRPRDIQRKVVDTRQIFASMHSDTSPLTALRGKCTILHKSEIEDLNDYRQQQNCFWYEKLFDRYIHRYYEVVPTKQVVNMPANVKKVLDERWKYIIVEATRAKELTSASKSCKRCSGFCTNATSVDCAVCHKTYHMKCVRPPLFKKPSRGFGWQCGPCSRAQSRKMEFREHPKSLLPTEEDFDDDDDEEMGCPEGEEGTGIATPIEGAETEMHPATEEQIYQASLWPFRYLGIHCKVEDCLDYDDRIYPRAISRLGPKYQADVLPWPGRPVELVPRVEIKKKYAKGGNHKKEKYHKDTLAAIEEDKKAKENRPKWIEDEPVGYVARGEDYDNDDPRCTATVLFKPGPLKSDDDDERSRRNALIEWTIQKSKPIAEKLGLEHLSTNFMTETVVLLHQSGYDADATLSQLSKLTRKDLKEPDLSPAELKKFEDAVRKFGSELLSVKRHVKTVSAADIVRLYYVWKKKEGKAIWSAFPGRKGKKEAGEIKKVKKSELVDDVAEDQDDSAFDNEKAVKKGKGFVCKFCSTRHSRQWRRAPSTKPGEMVNVDSHGRISNKEKGTTSAMLALCLQCAIVWRRYAVQWDEGAEKGRAGNKRKAADDPMREFQLSDWAWTASNTEVANTPLGGSPAPQATISTPVPEMAAAPPRKKLKGSKEERESAIPATVKEPEVKKKEKAKVRESAPILSRAKTPEPTPQLVVIKKRPIEKPLPPPPPPEPPLPPPKTLPCAVCHGLEPLAKHIKCSSCRLSVHLSCYGISKKKIDDLKGKENWKCDTCMNDLEPLALATKYQCVLCPIEYTHHDFIDPPKVSHKKKTEKDRERERRERGFAEKAVRHYENFQLENGNPVNPREALKMTMGNKWAHVTCSVFTPEVRFGDAGKLEPVEGISSIPLARHKEVCKVCKDRKGKRGFCVQCQQCKAPVHVECANQAGWLLAFDITPVKGKKGDREDVVAVNGDAGTMAAAVWCREHVPKTRVHRMDEVAEEDKDHRTVLQVYCENFKQADLTQTGAMRKAAQTTITPAADAMVTPPRDSVPNRRSSTIASSQAIKAAQQKREEERRSQAATPSEGQCARCDIEVSARWYPVESTATANGNGSQVLAGMATAALHSGHGEMEKDVKPSIETILGSMREGEDVPVLCHRCYRRGLRAPPTPPTPPPVPPSPVRMADIPAAPFVGGVREQQPMAMEPQTQASLGVLASPAVGVAPPLPVINQHTMPPQPLYAPAPLPIPAAASYYPQHAQQHVVHPQPHHAPAHQAIHGPAHAYSPSIGPGYRQEWTQPGHDRHERRESGPMLNGHMPYRLSPRAQTAHLTGPPPAQPQIPGPSGPQAQGRLGLNSPHLGTNSPLLNRPVHAGPQSGPGSVYQSPRQGPPPHAPPSQGHYRPSSPYGHPAHPQHSAPPHRPHSPYQPSPHMTQDHGPLPPSHYRPASPYGQHYGHRPPPPHALPNGVGPRDPRDPRDMGYAPPPHQQPHREDYRYQSYGRDPRMDPRDPRGLMEARERDPRDVKRERGQRQMEREARECEAKERDMRERALAEQREREREMREREQALQNGGGGQVNGNGGGQNGPHRPGVGGGASASPSLHNLLS